MAQPPPAARSGELLGGKYRLLERLGMGGMGDVYRATHEAIGRVVAIKLLRSELSTTTEAIERLTREARAANLVRHPNVVDVLDFGTDDKLGVFLVQELLEGEDLSAYLARRGGRLPLDETLSIVLPVIGAAATAHASGVVHRDLKPGNIFLNRAPDGEWVPKVLDFGISKITGLSGRIDVSTLSVTLGTPAYMSPEQIQGEPVDARTDVWALGVILHQLLAGDLPFRGDSAGKQYVQICTAPPIPLEEAAPGTPPEIIAIVRRCLEKSADERYATAGELLAAFDGLEVAAKARSHTLVIQQPSAPAPVVGEPTGQSLAPVVARSSTAGRTPRRIAGALAIVALASLGVLAFVRSRTSHDPDPASAAARPSSPTPVQPSVTPTPTPPVIPPTPPVALNSTGSTSDAVSPGADAGAAQGALRHVTPRNTGRPHTGGNHWAIPATTHY